MAADKAKSYESLRIHISKVRGLAGIGSIFSKAVSVDHLLSLIVKQALDVMSADVCVLKLLDSSRNRLRLAAYAGLDGKKARAFAKLENGMAKRVLRSGMPCVISDAKAYYKNKLSAFFKRNKIHAALMVPLFSNKRKAGVLSVYIQGVRIFEKESIELFEMVASLCSMAIDNATMLDRIRKDYLNTIKTLAKIIDANDGYTRGHCDKVMEYSLLICRKLKLPARYVNAIKTASLLHDIGKIGIDLSVIKKAEKLTEEDWKKVRMHPEIGAKIISQVGFLNEVVPIIKYHHARFGGGGYPEPEKSRDEIPIGSRIIAVADAFDAMTNDRPYRKAMTREEAIKELKRCSGNQFDPKVVDAFYTSGFTPPGCKEGKIKI